MSSLLAFLCTFRHRPAAVAPAASWPPTTRCSASWAPSAASSASPSPKPCCCSASPPSLAPAHTACPRSRCGAVGAGWRWVAGGRWGSRQRQNTRHTQGSVGYRRRALNYWMPRGATWAIRAQNYGILQDIAIVGHEAEIYRNHPSSSLSLYFIIMCIVKIML